MLSGSIGEGLPFKPIRLTTTSSVTAATITIIPRLGFDHNEPPPLVFEVVESLDRRLSLGVRVHLDEAKPSAASRVTVRDDVDALDGAEGCEPSLQFR